MDTEYGHEESSRAVPAWIAPILQRESEAAGLAERHRENQGHRTAEVINQRLACLGIEPLSPARWVHGLIKAVLLEPGDFEPDDDGFGVRAGWHEDGVALFAYNPDTRVEQYVGPLDGVEAAANARRGPQHAPEREPTDHVVSAENWLYDAGRVSPDDVNRFQWAILASGQALAEALLAINDTLSRIGVRQALRHTAVLASIPDGVDSETRLWDALFPGQPITSPGGRIAARVEEPPDDMDQTVSDATAK